MAATDIEEQVRTDSPKAWLLASRPKTLSGAAVPVMIGLALAYSDASHIDYSTFKWLPALLCLLFAFIMQIDANFVNDYFDYVNGSDNREKRLGPKRACTQGWVRLESMRRAIAFTTAIACLVGLPLVVYGGVEMILIGIVCVVFCFLYTTHLSSKGLGDVLVVVFFGLVPVCTVYFIQLHQCTPIVVWAAVACGIVIDALLTINNFRDRDTDREAGKTTLVVVIGERNSLRLYLAIGWAAFLMGAAFAAAGHPLSWALQLPYIVLHCLTYRKMRRIFRGKQLNECLADTSRNILVYGITVSIGLLL